MIIKKQPDTQKHVRKNTFAAILAGLIILSAITGLTVRLIWGGANEITVSVIHIIAITALIVLCVVLIMIINRYRSELANLRQHASTDKLTELYNRSYLDFFLENQIEAANKTKHPISTVMVDLDHFKEINDNHGHIAGDQVLSIFAQVVLKCIRKTDIIARYGGDEFVVVLPDTDTKTAHVIAERIRCDVADAYIPPIDGDIIPSISCSVGISTYPVHCDSKYSLIRTSDIALYKAKRSGRNQTIVYSMEDLPN